MVGAHYIFPVQAKGKKDRLSIIQIEQDFTARHIILNMTAQAPLACATTYHITRLFAIRLLLKLLLLGVAKLILLWVGALFSVSVQRLRMLLILM